MKARPTPPPGAASATQPGSTPELLDQIRLRAYELFEQRGRNQGHDLEDWLQAETEVLQHKGKTTAA